MAFDDEQGRFHRIGAILLRRGLVRRDELDRILKERGEHGLLPLGAALRDLGMVSGEGLRSAVEEQRRLRRAVLEHVRVIPRLGDILRRRGLIGEDELAAALDEQAPSWETLGEILLRRGRLKASDLERALRDQKALRVRVLEALATVPRLGDLLCRKGLISASQLEDALARQEGSGVRLGSLLVRDGVLAIEDLVASLTEQTHLRNAALAALLGVALALQPMVAQAGDSVATASSSVQISLTIPQKVEVAPVAGQTQMVDVLDATSASGMAPVVLLSPVDGPAHVEIHGSGPDGSLVATTADGTQLAYHVELHDPLTGQVTYLDAGQSVDLAAMPSLIQIGFDNLPASGAAPVFASGTLTVMVGPQF